ncbi:MAG: lytic transglycosylase domain-containing protein [Anaerolineales bacterium]|nr:lytic transglycosylase domain-containing protein [Anaerolineales bacterium]
MKPWGRVLTAVALAIAIGASACPAIAQEADPTDRLALSPYWTQAITRWERLIQHYSEQNQFDADFIAAVIWKESLGRPTAHSPAGAVGLMMLMPFPWRPSPQELENPYTNVAWGTRTLLQIIGDGDGDLYYALAAYNGSWEKVDQSNTRRYAASVLDHYSRAVAMEYGLPLDGDWAAVFAVEGGHGPKTITVIGPQQPVARYTERMWHTDLPSVPPGFAPHATVVAFLDEQGEQCAVRVWLMQADGLPVPHPLAPTPVTSSTPDAVQSLQVLSPFIPD